MQVDKQGKIIKMFDEIAPTYDTANRVLSFGIDVSWRREAIKEVFASFDEKKSFEIVDVACGTGDMLIEWAKLLPAGAKLCLKGVDLSEGMLALARKKVSGCEFIHASADALPLEDNTADIISISYGIRNVVKRVEALGEFARVLRPGGVLLVLEFTKRDKEGLSAHFRDFYLKHIMPKLGGMISKNHDAYEYLQSSIEGFVSTDEFCEELAGVGLEKLSVKAYSMGICTQFIYQKK